jgi:uncharacterized membrane protein
MQLAADFTMFFGRFHPLFIHLPIGLLDFAVFMELLQFLKPRDSFAKTISLIWLAAAVSSIFSATAGYFLSVGGGYEETTLNLHKISGITLAVISTGCYLLAAFPLPFFTKGFKIIRTALMAFISVLLILTGHWGGSLTHGSNYLMEYAPIVGTGSQKNQVAHTKISGLDSADIFNDAVMPILQSKCVSCHNKEKKKGGLLLTSYEEILAGGKSREGVIPGNTSTSEIFRRITLPKEHKEFMPSDGKIPLTESQIAILEFWIETGAHRNITIANLKPNKKIETVFGDFFQLGRAAILSYSAKPAAKNDLVELLKEGFQVYAINESNNLLEVKFIGPSTTKPDLSVLESVKDQLVWLQLANCGITDEDLKIIGNLPNLFKLNLNRNKITDKGITALSGLNKLELLNLYGTAITDSSIGSLQNLTSLKKLYVWETGVDTTRMEMISKSKKGLEIVYKLVP